MDCMRPNVIWQSDGATQDLSPGRHFVDVCICAFARESGLLNCLQSLVTQINAPPFRVIIADNHVEPVVPAWLSLAGAYPFPVVVVHAPQQNIAVARNACLQTANAEWIAFIDDDEFAAPEWLATLVASASTHSSDVVFGRVQAIYPQDAPAWLVRGDFLSKAPARSGAGITTGYTANVLIRRRCIASLRFDPAYGQTGGEDTLFFAAMHRHGAGLSYCPSAHVYEPEDSARCSLRALWLRGLGSGHTHARVLRAEEQTRLRIGVLAGAKAIACTLLMLGRLHDAAGWRRELLRMALHFGVARQVMGWPAPRLYGNAQVAAKHST